MASKRIKANHSLKIQYLFNCHCSQLNWKTLKITFSIKSFHEHNSNQYQTTGGPYYNLLVPPSEPLTFRDSSSTCYQCYKPVQSTFENSHRLTVGANEGRGRKIEVSPCCFVANRALLGPRGRYGVPLTNWWLLSPIRMQHQPPRLCLESQDRLCTMPRTATGFYNPRAEYAAGRGEDERRRRGEATVKTAGMNWFTWAYAGTVKSCVI